MSRKLLLREITEAMQSLEVFTPTGFEFPDGKSWEEIEQAIQNLGNSMYSYVATNLNDITFLVEKIKIRR